ncbi:MAG: hypothetical protein ACXAD7_15655 [Candidatus Kariarchaeaceae archaeon]|jgi:hypothetical protein
MKSKDFEKMANEREEFAQTLSDYDIWKQVVQSAITIEADPEMKANILITSIPDIGVIFTQLKEINQNGDLSNKEYRQIVEICMKKLENQMVDFDPRLLEDLD